LISFLFFPFVGFVPCVLPFDVSMADFPLSQVSKARTLMQKVWDTGKPWETLVSGEFFG
jgi:hypothetical protein